MSSFPWIAHLSAETWLGIGAVVILLGLLLVVRVGRKRYVVVSSGTADLIVYHLSRIADALDRGALEGVASRELPRRSEAPVEPVRKAEPREEAPPAATVREARPVGLSMFGR